MCVGNVQRLLQSSVFSCPDLQLPEPGSELRHLGLQVFDPDGELIGIIDKPQKSWLANAVFAGPNLDTLYVTCRDKVYKRKINAQGIRYFDPESQP